jgi:asparagine synthase (glutamine-hydrolysing)
MCGITVCLGKSAKAGVVKSLSFLEARGPEGSKVTILSDRLAFGFTRLAINGLTPDGMQPFHKRDLTWMCNGEIYNSNELNFSLGINSAGSDCYCIGDLYLRHQDDLATFARSLDGVFAVALYDSVRNRLILARDPYGIRPLYVGTDLNGNMCFASEIKALTPQHSNIRHFPPGTIEVYNINTLTLSKRIQYHTVPWITNTTLTPTSAIESVRTALLQAVEKRMLTDRPVAALLSGGLDSSLIASIVQRFLTSSGQPPLKTFSIGFKGSSDLKHAKLVADYIGSDHTEIEMTPDEFFNAIPEVIKAIESYDTTTVRASVGNYLIAKEIRNRSECKVVFNGDGADELFGGYLYFRSAPNDAAFHSETGRLLEDIHFFDVLRSDRSISSNGLEARTPFLDKQFVAVVRSLSPSLLRPLPGKIEKSILRESFYDGWLPEEVLMRRKEAFSDGVSSPEKAWFQEIQERVSKCIPHDWRKHNSNMEHLRPQTPEEYYYRAHFDNYYPNAEKVNVPYRWMPKWSPETTDPSARTLNVYNESSSP